MEGSITKSQLCWVLIRGLGIYLLAQAVITFFTLMNMMATWGQQFRNALPGSGSGSGISGTSIFYLVFSAAIPAAIGIYLLLSGRLIYRSLMREPALSRKPKPLNPCPSSESAESFLQDRSTSWLSPKNKLDPDDKIDPRTTLSLKESQKFSRWLEDHPEHLARSESDRIALFRDAQKKGDIDE